MNKIEYKIGSISEGICVMWKKEASAVSYKVEVHAQIGSEKVCIIEAYVDRDNRVYSVDKLLSGTYAVKIMAGNKSGDVIAESGLLGVAVESFGESIVERLIHAIRY